MKLNTLSNGIKVVTDKNDYALSATIGVWVRVGSVDEDENKAGISHFIEHMMFKGTKMRSAKDIAFEMDSVGGVINAFTSKECTCYNATVTFEHLDKAVILLADMLKNSSMLKTELEKERSVILEEINMVEDSPDDVIHRLHCENVFKGCNVSKSVTGSKDTVSGLSSDDLKGYIGENYTADRIIISVAGRFDEEALLLLLEKEFGSGICENGKGRIYKDAIPNLNKDKSVVFKNMPIEQTHVCIGFLGLEHNSDRLYDLYVFNTLFGGGMSSRLFQKIREEKGLCYTVYSYCSPYMNTGAFNIYSATNKGQVKRLINVALEEISGIMNKGVLKQEFEMAREQMKGNYILGCESTSGRMNSLGRSLLLNGEPITPEMVIEKIDAVTIDSMEETIKMLFDMDKKAITLVGNINEDEFKEIIG